MHLRHIGTAVKLLGLAVMVYLLIPVALAFTQDGFSSQPLLYLPEGAPSEGSEVYDCWVRAFVGIAGGSVIFWLGDVIKPREWPMRAIGCLLAVAGIALCINRLFLVPHGRSLVEKEYQAQGFQMVKGLKGINVEEAGDAGAQVWKLRERYMAARVRKEATNVIIQLKSAIAIAREKERVLNDDLDRRGECDTYPWKTNWAMIEEVLTASDKLYH
jgi:hypothetical protein